MKDQAAPPSRGSSLGLGFLAGLAGGLVAALVSYVFGTSSEPASSAAVPSSATDLSSLEHGLADLRDNVDRLRLDLSAMIVAKSSGPSQALVLPEEAGPSHAELARLIERISIATGAAMEPPDFDPAKKEPLREYIAARKQVPIDMWRLWSPAQLVATYGSPSFVTPSDKGLRWGYVFDDGSQAVFDINEGMACEIMVVRPSQ